MDPCAGEGSAIFNLAIQIGINRGTFYGCEMESLRYAGLNDKFREYYTSKILQGDAFRITYTKTHKEGVSLLYLNPPYDLDKVYGRLENKFLTRFSDALVEAGILVFVIPYYALKASAHILAKEYTDLSCYRFPEPDFQVYKQIVLFGKKRASLMQANPVVEEMVIDWSTNYNLIPRLDSIRTSIYELPKQSSAYSGGLDTWKINPIDLLTVKNKVRPWHQTARKGQPSLVPNTIPDVPVQDLLLRTYPLATPPRPAHIAAGIASGIFNGSQLEPNQGVELPKLLVKGAFDREFITVDEKKDKDGNVKALVQVQQPKLVISVLNLDNSKYYTLKSDIDVVADQTPNIESLNLLNLINYYGNSMMQVMEKQCPISYDPRKDADTIEITQAARKPYEAQAHAIKAMVKLLGGNKATRKQRKGKGVILLGEIGVGKSTVALLTSKTIQAKRPLVICPPHLLDTWKIETKAVYPEAKIKIIKSVSDLEDLAKIPHDQTVVSVLSREAAKLGYSWAGIGAKCPTCNFATPDVDLAKKRARCQARKIVPSSKNASMVQSLARSLSKYAPANPNVTQLLNSPFDLVATKHYAKVKPEFKGLTSSQLESSVKLALPYLLENYTVNRTTAESLLTLCCYMADDPALQGAIVHSVIAQDSNNFGRKLVNLLPEGKIKDDLIYKYHVMVVDDDVQIASFIYNEGKLDGCGKHSLNLAIQLLTLATKLVKFTMTEPCGEFLYQAVPEPRRISLADHICKYYRNTFDILILDEAHEFSSEDSAQSQAAHRIQNLGLPTILQTGSIMNGYAASMFINMWYTSAAFRHEFSLADSSKFVDRYGYRKRILEDKDSKTGKVVEFGSNSDRVIRSARITGNAPGVLPLFLLKHLLPVSVTLHKSDLAIDLPQCKLEKFLVEPSKELADNYAKLKAALIAAIKADRFKPERAGKLFGQLAELPSYLDRATVDIGNCPTGDFEIRYPESIGFDLVATVEGLPAETLLPKEVWLLDKIEQEIAEGRRVMVFSWHTSLLSRLSRIISERIGETVPVLYANKVAAGKRQEWINKEVVSKKRKVMVTNPVCVQTGLNNLIHFSTEIWLENPAVNSTIYRQAVGRVDRIGQKLEIRILFPIYADTLQEQTYDLLMRKVSISTATDGLDPEAAISASGGGSEDFLAGLSLGKQLWQLLAQG